MASPENTIDGVAILREAEFDPRVCDYWMLSGTLILIVTIVGIPLLLIWLPLGRFVTRRYLRSHRCVLTKRTLKFEKGILTKIEKTVPLDKITDLGFVQGPLMRLLGVESLTIETAGQSGPGALVQLAGVKDCRDFRDTVLAQRDKVTELKEDAESGSQPTAGETGAQLAEIHGTLLRIEKLLQDR